MASKRIVLTTIGSLGDLHPYVALGLGLKAQGGFTPVIATSELYREKVEREGLEFAAVRPNLEDLGDEQELMAKVMDPLHGPSYVIREVVLRHVRETHADLLEACRGADLIVGHVLTYTVPIVADELRVPWVGAVLQPMIFLSAYDPPVLGPLAWLSRRPWGPRFHGSVMKLCKRLLRGWARPLDQLRAERGQPKFTNHPLFEAIFSPHLNLALFSKHFAPAQPDWPAHTIQCGFPFYDKGMQDEHVRLTPQLEAFLASGEPPVVFTLGSSAVVAAGTFYHESFRAAKQAGLRAVLLVGRDDRNRPSEPIPANICVDDYAPYSLLFPRAAAVVHQGGVGTTGQVLAAGKPMVIVPFSHDQPDNAQRVKKLGCGAMLSRRGYTAARISAVLKQLQSPETVRRAAEIGRLISREDGTSCACEAIEELLERRVAQA